MPEVADLDAFVASLGEGTIHDFAHRTALERPDAVAVTIGGESLTFAEIDEMATHAAAGIDRGTPVALAEPVSARWIGTYLGILRAGAIAVPLNPAYTREERDRLMSAAGATQAGDDVALIAFTSGTTGAPKAVPLTHRNLLTSVRAAMAAWRWSADDVLVHGLPLFHLHGLNGLHATLIAGSRLCLLARFSPEALAAALDTSGASVLFGVPTMYQRLAGSPPMRNRLRLCVSGSASLSAEAARAAAHALGHVPLVRYGLTESGLDTSQVYGGVHGAGSVGIPLPGVLVRLAEDGEIELQGPQVYTDGWFRTGDIGALDEASGELMIVGRLKEIVITGGLKVHPREVEAVLEEHPSVAEAAVAGVPSERWGEEVTAWVVLKPGEAFDASELIRHARAHLAPHKTPKAIHEVSELPRNPVGKIDRKRLTSPA
ncbi:MAG TPA: AMP-binding protein [Candidatus Dormibacteraeota bacterium]|nr:AMP-binding protein [Candidatus Dormibacteraeota bacterium]